MHLSLDTSQLNAWLRQQEYDRASNFSLAEGITLSCQRSNDTLNIELNINQSLVSADWLDNVLEKRYSDLARYRHCIPIDRTETDWVLRFSGTSAGMSQEDYMELGVMPLLSLAGISIN